MDIPRPPRMLMPRPRPARKPTQKSPRARTSRGWLPVAGSALAIALALFALPSLLAIDLSLDGARQPAPAFPVTVYPDEKTIVVDPNIEELLSVAPAPLAAAVSQVGTAYEWLAVRISELPLYRQIAGAAGIESLFVTISPGQRAEEVAFAFGNKLGWTRTERIAFLEEVESREPNLPDGQFVPGTYFVGVTSPKDVADITYERFAKEILARYSTTTEAVVPLKDALTVASLIEREAGSWDDMRLISGVIWNRLFTNMNLQIDATMQYSKATLAGGKGGWWPTPLPSDKSIRHAYNTYRGPGLPPGPISNPSVAAVVAALNPKKTDCLFYFHDKYGRFYCSETYSEHVTLLRKHYGQGR